jgi:hypothetical protein
MMSLLVFVMVGLGKFRASGVVDYIITINPNVLFKMLVMGLSILVLTLNNVSFSLTNFNKLGFVIDEDTEHHLKNHQCMLYNYDNDQELGECPISG